MQPQPGMAWHGMGQHWHVVPCHGMGELAWTAPPQTKAQRACQAPTTQPHLGPSRRCTPGPSPPSAAPNMACQSALDLAASRRATSMCAARSSICRWWPSELRGQRGKGEHGRRVVHAPLEHPMFKSMSCKLHTGLRASEPASPSIHGPTTHTRTSQGAPSQLLQLLLQELRARHRSSAWTSRQLLQRRQAVCHVCRAVCQLLGELGDQVVQECGYGLRRLQPVGRRPAVLRKRVVDKAMPSFRAPCRADSCLP